MRTRNKRLLLVALGVLIAVFLALLACPGGLLKTVAYAIIAFSTLVGVFVAGTDYTEEEG